jgi:retron-type reverse transcriptase
VLIPKPGTTEQGPLSIPPVRDRIAQAAVTIVLEPVFEADFLPDSFGFRPRRSAHEALQVLIDECWRGRPWVVETDIARLIFGLGERHALELRLDHSSWLAVEEKEVIHAAERLLKVNSRTATPGPAARFSFAWS